MRVSLEELVQGETVERASVHNIHRSECSRRRVIIIELEAPLEGFKLTSKLDLFQNDLNNGAFNVASEGLVSPDPGVGLAGEDVVPEGGVLTWK